MQSRLGLAHFFVFVFCGLISISACCLGVFGVIAQGHQPVRPLYAALFDMQSVQGVRQSLTHPKEKEWEPVFVLSQYQSGHYTE